MLLNRTVAGVSDSACIGVQFWARIDDGYDLWVGV